MQLSTFVVRLSPRQYLHLKVPYPGHTDYNSGTGKERKHMSLTDQSSKKYRGMATSDGAGVNLVRIVGTPRLPDVDPFLLLDEFRSDDKEDWIAGFPDHPHRGFETITYMKQGAFRHHDSKGHSGRLVAGGAQWMRAGRGAVHSEMPDISEGSVWGYQLWLNLPAQEKMSEPDYRDYAPSEIPVLQEGESTIVVIAGKYQNARGPVSCTLPLTYLDIDLSGHSIAIDTPHIEDSNREKITLIYLYEGALEVELDNARREELEVEAGDQRGILLCLKELNNTYTLRSARKASFLFLSSLSTGEPIERSGPFVMNTKEEIRKAYLDYQKGLF